MVIRFVRLLVTFLSCISLTVPATAATLTGRVVDPDGRPVADATVIVTGEGQPLRTAVANGRGEFTLDAPDDVTLEVRVALPGFRSETLTVEPGDRTDLGEIRLAVSAVSEAVVVSAARVEIPLSEASSTVSVMSGAELRVRQVRSVADALRSVPGLAVAATGGHGAVTGVFPRGGESNFTLVFVDDVPVNAFGGEFDFAHLSTENVERIEIVRGPQSALFGSNAIGGVVRIVTRRGGIPAGSATLEGGGYETMRLSAATSGTAGRFEWGASGERLSSEGFNGRRSAAGLRIENDDYTRDSGALSLGWRTGGTAIRGHFRQEHHDRGTPGPFGTNPIGAYTGIDTASRGDNEQTIGSVSASLPVTGRLRTVFQTGFHRLNSDFASPFGPSESGSRRWFGRAQADMTLTGRAEVSFGAELQRERATSTFITDSAFAEAPVERTLGGYFGEVRWKAPARIHVSGGVRLDDIRRSPIGASPAPDDDHVFSINPRVAVSWLVKPETESLTRIRASAATGIRPPGAFDIAFTNNPSLKPERSVSTEAALEQAFLSGRARVEAVAFFNEYDDLIVAVGSFQQSSRYTTDNIANARARGLELGVSAAHRFVPARPIDLQARVAYTFVDSEVLAVDRDHQAPPPFAVGDPLLRRPRHQVSADITVTGGPLTAFVSGRGRGRALDVEPSTGTFGGLFYNGGFGVWNAGLSWRVHSIGEVFGRVENLFDRTYEEALGFPALGRRATMGVRVAAGR